jgi:predicted Zn-dependent peptidase
MRFNIIESKRLGEKVYHIHHETGADIYIEPKKGYSSKYAIFGTKYGSIDNSFKVGNENIVVPEGIAHFLEHKLFESEGGDAFQRYARTGASANAYTSFDKTCYLFSCTDKFNESLEILLDFVQNPFFSEKTVQKEQGIIGQEIRMYLDDPNWRVFFNLLSALYHTHPVKIDIAGTEQSISQISADLLYKCYNAFYNLNNMVLSVCGDIEPEQVLEIADRLFKKNAAPKVESIFLPEPDGIVKNRIEQKLSVSVPLFHIGFKDVPVEGYTMAKKEAVSSILLEIIGGDASPLYRKLYDKGIINASFGMQYFSGRSFASTVIGGESREPDAVMNEFMSEINRLKANGISSEDYDRAKKTVFGRLVAHYDNVDGIANGLVGSHFAGMAPFDIVEAVAEVTPEDIHNSLTSSFDENKAALSVVLPI